MTLLGNALRDQERVEGLAAMLDDSPSAIVREALSEANAASAPIPLPEGLPKVAEFDGELLPPLLRKYVEDIADRMQCPPDFPAVALLSVLSAAVGRRLGISPKRLDDWTVVPNLWAMVIGRPGIMKSPPP